MWRRGISGLSQMIGLRHVCPPTHRRHEPTTESPPKKTASAPATARQPAGIGIIAAILSR